MSVHWQLEIGTLRKLAILARVSLLLTFFHPLLKARVAAGIFDPGARRKSGESGKKWKKVKKATTRFADAFPFLGDW